MVEKIHKRRNKKQRAGQPGNRKKFAQSGKNVPHHFLDSHLKGLLGFALKSRTAVCGYESVRRNCVKQKVALVLIDETLGESSLKKILKITVNERIPVCIIQSQSDSSSLLSLTGYKIIGFQRGELVKEFLKYLSQESQ
ncbi:MAG: hypothetical protein D6748_13295 [Calditrichaeota bacterium]|nr:MAG: hypothetical protein D6748_13295 [Calditrichota bacterium]